MAAGFTYHMEALRKTQVLQRKHEAQTRIREATVYGEMPNTNARPVSNDNELNFSNKPSSNEHSDPAYRLIYPNSDNFDYLRDVNQKDRRRLCNEANYNAFRAVNFGCQPKNNFLLSSGCGVDVRPLTSAQWWRQYKAVKCDEKILHNNNMVMGPLNAFLPAKANTKAKTAARN